MTTSDTDRRGPRVLPRSRLGSVLLAEAEVETLPLRLGGSGLVVGVDDEGTPVPIVLFRPEPTVGMAVGSLALAQVLCLRALAVGAHVLVQTARPDSWERLVRLGAPGRSMVQLTEHAAEDQPGTAGRPRLLLVDSESTADVEVRRGAQWTATVTLHDQITPLNVASLASADLVLLQGLSLAEARLAGGALDVADPEATLGQLADDAVVVASRATVLRCRLSSTRTERWLFGPPERHPGQN